MKVSNHPKDIEQLLSKYEKVFGDLPPGRPPDRGVEHIIELEIGTQPIKMYLYRKLETPKGFEMILKRPLKNYWIWVS